MELGIVVLASSDSIVELSATSLPVAFSWSSATLGDLYLVANLIVTLALQLPPTGTMRDSLFKTRCNFFELTCSDRMSTILQEICSITPKLEHLCGRLGGTITPGDKEPHETKLFSPCPSTRLRG